MKPLQKTLYFVSLALIISFRLEAQDSRIEEIMNQVSLDSLIKHVRILSGEDSLFVSGNSYLIKNRTYDQPGNELAAEYLELMLTKYGLNPVTAEFNENGKNVIAVQEGKIYPDEYYIICGHYDAVADYCADDNVSSCAAILETARILSGIDLNRSIIYAFWDEEEISLLGSRYFAEIAYSNSINIAGVVNIEMLGWDSDDDGLFDIHVRDIANTIQLGELLANTANEYDLELTSNIINPGTTRSDHAAFWEHGYTALAFSEAFFSGDGNPYYHTAEDRIDKMNMDYFHKLSKLTAGITGRLAFDGLGTTVAVNNDEELIAKYNLSHNYPNPFNPSTTISYSIPKQTLVSLKIYDVLGKEIAKLVDEEKAAGVHKLEFDASNLSSGVYFYRINAGNFQEVRKMMLIK